MCAGFVDLAMKSPSYSQSGSSGFDVNHRERTFLFESDHSHRVQCGSRIIGSDSMRTRKLLSHRAVLTSQGQPAKGKFEGWKRRALFHTVTGLDYRRRTVSEDRRRVYGCEVQVFTVSLNGANILSTPSCSSAR